MRQARVHLFACAVANSRLDFKPDRAFHRVAAAVGVNEPTRGKRAALRFGIYGDGGLLAAATPCISARRGWNKPRNPRCLSRPTPLGPR